MHLFISKNNHEISVLKTFCTTQTWSLQALSLIETRALSFDLAQAYDWVFFASKNAVHFYLQQQAIPKDCRIGCAGQGTAAALKAAGYTAHFIAENSGTPRSEAQKWLACLGEEHAFFPCSTRSLGSYHQDLPEQQKTVFPIYETSLCPAQIPRADIYVFTSPSNWEAFRLVNILPEGSKAIAWGSSTAQAMNKDGFPAQETLSTASEAALVDLLSSLRK